jgi:hypothetical protein
LKLERKKGRGLVGWVVGGNGWIDEMDVMDEMNEMDEMNDYSLI